MNDALHLQSADTVEDLRAEVVRLNKIVQALMNRAERNARIGGSDFDLFHTAITLEDQVKLRTRELEAALRENEKITRALRESENHNRLLVEHSPLCIHEIGLDGRITSMNKSGLSMLGARQEHEVQGLPYLDSVSPADRDRIADLLARAYAGETSHFEFVSSGPGGQIYKSCFVPIRNKAGAVEKLMGITEDISERKRIEVALNDLNRDFVAFLENTTDFIYFKDKDSRFRFCSQTLADITGHASWKDMIGKHDLEVFPEETAHIYHEEEQPVFRDGVALMNKTDPYFDAQGRRGWVSTNKWPLRDAASKNVIGLFGISRDVTERMNLELQLSESEALFHSIFNQTDSGIELIEPDTLRFVEVNPAACRMLGYTHEEYLQLHLDDTQADLDHEAVLASLQKVKESEGVVFTNRHRCKDGQMLDVEINARMLGLPGKRLIVAVWRDITESKKAEEQVRNLAFYDILTQLANRRLLEDRLGQAMVSSKRSGCYGAVMFLDLDNFKPLNDAHGHEMGDLLLIEVAQRITRCVRGMDTVARFGGDEFVVMLGELDMDIELSMAQARIVAEKIRVTLAAPYQLARETEGLVESVVEHHCTASIGVVLFMGHEACQEDILKQADVAMYQAKEAGRNSVRFFDKMFKPAA